MKIRTTGRGTSEKRADTSTEYLTRSSELRYSMHIPGWISVSKVVGRDALDCVYKPTVFVWLVRQASWIQIRAIHTLFLLDFIDYFSFPLLLPNRCVRSQPAAHNNILGQLIDYAQILWIIRNPPFAALAFHYFGRPVISYCSHDHLPFSSFLCPLHQSYNTTPQFSTAIIGWNATRM